MRKKRQKRQNEDSSDIFIEIDGEIEREIRKLLKEWEKFF
jgi:hypothetical protein